MDCQRAQGQIPAYRAGQLDTADRRALESHLSGCPQCAERFAAADQGDHRDECGPRPVPDNRWTG